MLQDVDDLLDVLNGDSGVVVQRQSWAPISAGNDDDSLSLRDCLTQFYDLR